jgi:flavin reductase (DIM6/NTAB) family NADH-FMN oxidoreductase RutF
MNGLERLDTCAFVLSTDPQSLRASGLAATWLTRAAHKPVIWTVALLRNSYTLKLVLASHEFVLAFATPQLKKEFLYFGTVSAHDIQDKLNATGLRLGKFEDASVKTPLLLDAHANIACSVTTTSPSGSDYLLVSGRVLCQQGNAGTRQLFYKGKDAAGERQFL